MIYPVVSIAMVALAASAVLAAPGHYAAPGLAAVPAPVVVAPAPYATEEVVGAPVTTIHKPAAQVSKQIHYGTTTYVSGYDSEVLKPAIPDLNVAVPTALRHTTSFNPAVVSVQKETHVVNEHFNVPKPYDVPYDVIKPVEQIVEVPSPVHVAKPVPVAVPTPVIGQPILQRIQTAPIVKYNHHQALAIPAVAPLHLAAAPAIAAQNYAVPVAHAAVAADPLWNAAAVVPAPAHA